MVDLLVVDCEDGLVGDGLVGVVDCEGGLVGGGL